ncbi:macrosialin isoform X1 [Peromyscus leucopus]|uniref:macrosialin isoform X1 n=1 Tax=Peromyscus leucopus TaxID=10041 RepID=UPI0010A1C212|nr:macrosialin isoform X1 [Peromyscus leucopus]
MRFQVPCLVLLGLLVAQGTGKDCPRRKAATLLPSFTMTTTESTASPTTSHRPTTTSHRPTTTSHGNVTVHPTSKSTTTSSRPTTSTHSPAVTTSHGNATVYPTTDNGTAPTPGSTTGPPPGPPPPSPSPRPGSEGALGNYTWMNGSQPCVRLQAQIQIRILYPTQGGGKAWGISTLNPNKTKVQGGCDSAESHLPLSFPYGQLTFGFKQDLEQSPSIYLNYMAVEYNVSFPQAAQWTFSAQNSSLRELQAPLGQSFCCRNTSIVLSPAVHLDLLSLRLQAAQLPNTGHLGPCFSCASDQSLLLPLIIGLVLLGLLALVLIAFCVTRRRQSAYQPL